MPRSNEGEPQKERDTALYYQAARFPSEELSAFIYGQTQELLYRSTCDLSVYRFLVDQISHIAILGEQPPPELEANLTALLVAGEVIALPGDILRALVQRRRQMRQHGSWVEGHYRPGRRLR